MRELYFENWRLAVLPVAFVFVAVVSTVWLQLVSWNVPNPYLDEVFHVQQAQAYCAGAFRQWDPKITTPPGLYITSYIFYRLTGRCDIFILRSQNAILICMMLGEAVDILRRLRQANLQKASQQSIQGDGGVRAAILDVHTATNICLFPPLFFFSSLYYTDVMSTWCVLQCYKYYLQSREPDSSGGQAAVTVIVGGFVSLWYRQTNIFWVAVFPAGLSVLDALKGGNTISKSEAGDIDWSALANQSWQYSEVYDCPVCDATLEDYVAVILSVGLAALGKIPAILISVAPYLVVLGIFGGFVAWNGSVVLGDKSNHVATLHFPQMLYIWPYIMFFSFTLAVPLLLGPLVRMLLQGVVESSSEGHLGGSFNQKPPRIILSAVFIALGSAAVHYNTIVHPFTLADNRHYVFYVFRLLLRHPALKYMAVLVYIFCGWAAIQCFGFKPINGPPDQTITSRRNRKGKSKALETRENHDQSCQVSFVIVWLATTALSVITAPLVEPRYFIIPWIMWRLHVPSIAASPSSSDATRDSPSKSPSLWKKVTQALGQGYDLRLWLETAWFFMINFFTAYMFLYRGFVWPQEPGKVQRFMW
ncbi:glycosyltransferase family 59 protein [Lepidopterella palustris CBS 459.81]|uniref:Dol-P-Glc:Glc(2)Man(9)GlcNAc(2)-PP-Dol alpha-1,2-glucosyltransferase n=1 Tax=Lepidopterella palustris CBS 459.81 TaxID=1314670 RepID=A0A8E2E658_9PEZI|nr:glycosyltransferase family 59 protein [Lepidopterella palustris CBS 459.81]